MSINFEESDLPEVVLDEKRTDKFTYVHVGEWSFCVEDDLEDGKDGRWWDDAKSWIAYAQYLDKVKAERSSDSAIE
jgi:hypothetical protein